MVQGQQTVQYLRQPNGQLIPIGVAPPMAASSSATPNSAASVVDMGGAEKLASATVATDPSKAPSKTTTTSPSTLVAMTTNNSLTTTVTLPTVTTTPASRTIGVVSQVTPSATQQTSTQLLPQQPPPPPPPPAVVKTSTPPTMVPQTQSTTTPIQVSPLTQPPPPPPAPPKQQYQTIQLTLENHQKLTKVQEEMKKFQGQKLSDKQMKQFQQLQMEQQRILSEGKPLAVPPDAQLSVSTSTPQMTNNQFANASSAPSILPPQPQQQQPVLVQAQSVASAPVAANSPALSNSIPSGSSTPNIVRPLGATQVMIGAPSAPVTSQQNMPLTIGPRMPGGLVMSRWSCDYISPKS